MKLCGRALRDRALASLHLVNQANSLPHPDPEERVDRSAYLLSGEELRAYQAAHCLQALAPLDPLREVLRLQRVRSIRQGPLPIQPNRERECREVPRRLL